MRYNSRPRNRAHSVIGCEHTPHHWSWKLEQRGKASKKSLGSYKVKYSCLNGCCPAVPPLWCILPSNQPVRRASQTATRIEEPAPWDSTGDRQELSKRMKAFHVMQWTSVGVCWTCLCGWVSHGVYCNMTRWLRLRSWWLERTVVASTKSPERMSDRMPDSARTYTGELEELASCFVAYSMHTIGACADTLGVDPNPGLRRFL